MLKHACGRGLCRAFGSLAGAGVWIVADISPRWEEKPTMNSRIIRIAEGWLAVRPWKIIQGISLALHRRRLCRNVSLQTKFRLHILSAGEHSTATAIVFPTPDCRAAREMARPAA
jgi:hypothetical protein